MKTVLFVCTGNTCRSPMAECLFRAMTGQENVNVMSAGIYAFGGSPASRGAMRAMERRGLSLKDHRAQAVTGALLKTADLVVGMSPGHIAQLQRLYPECRTPMIVFDDPPVSDPYGGDDAAYECAACDIERQLAGILYRICEGGQMK